MVRLYMSLEDMADRSTSQLGQTEVLFEVIEVGIAHGELAFALSAEEVGSAASSGVKNLAKDHDVPPPTTRLVPVSIGRPAAAQSG